MIGIVEFFTFRTIILLLSTTISILIVMLMVGIITVHDIQVMFNLSDDKVVILNNIIGKLQVVWNNVMDILSQLINKLFNFAGIDVDLSKIHVDINSTNDAVNGAKDAVHNRNP